MLDTKTKTNTKTIFFHWKKRPNGGSSKDNKGCRYNYACSNKRSSGRTLWHGTAVLCLVAALLPSCAALHNRSIQQSESANANRDPASASEPAIVLASEQRFSGRMAVVVRAQAVQERARQFAAQFHLRTTGAGERGTLMLVSPLGTTVGQVKWSPTQAVVIDGSGAQTRFDSFATMMHEMIGVRVTARTLLRWMQPTESASTIQHEGWMLDSSHYSVAQRAGVIKVKRNEPLPAIRITLVLDSVVTKNYTD